jgi:S1-C subfamily serine protease
MNRLIVVIVALCSLLLSVDAGQAQQLIERYEALLSERDHFNSSGQRISSAAAIIRQDRANFHRFNIRDKEDETDGYFADTHNREPLEALLSRGQSTPEVIDRIVNGTPLIRVEVWRANSGPFVTVTVLSSNTGGTRSADASPSPPAAPAETSPEQTESKSGTGFFVSVDGFLITNEHVISGCSTLELLSATKERIKARLVASSKADDLALLKTEFSPPATATFQESVRLLQGATVVAYGCPLSSILASKGNVSVGLVTALSGLGDDTRRLQISAPVQPGNSGGPLVDKSGALVGVVVAKLNAVAMARLSNDIPQNVNFAIKVSSVIDLLEANGVKFRRASLEKELTIEALTQQLREYTVPVECRP